MKKWTTCMECGETLYADANGDFFCTYCDGYDPETDLDCWLDDDESSSMRWVSYSSDDDRD